MATNSASHACSFNWDDSSLALDQCRAIRVIGHPSREVFFGGTTTFLICEWACKKTGNIMGIWWDDPLCFFFRYIRSPVFLHDENGHVLGIWWELLIHQPYDSWIVCKSGIPTEQNGRQIRLRGKWWSTQSPVGALIFFRQAPSL